MAIEDNASIALIPSGYKSGKLYSVIPDDGDGDFTHSRGSTATRVAASGLIETVASGVPRLDYPLIDGVVQDCPALLLEPQRENKQVYSEEFNNAAWSKSGSLVTADQIISPDGNLTADKLNDNNSGTGVVQIFDNIFSLTSSGTYTFSVFAKKGTINYVALRTENFTTPSNSTSYFDLDSGALGTIDSQHTAKITNYGNGWYRCSITFTLSTDVAGTLVIRANEADNTPNVVMNGNKNIYLWGAMMEESSFASSYIHTPTNATVTRSADVCNSAGTSAEFNDSEGVLFAEIEALADDSSYNFISISDGSLSDRVSLFFSNTNTLNGSAVGVSSIASSVDITNNNKAAYKYKSGDYALWVNGFEVGVSTSTSGSHSGLNTLNFDYGQGSDDFYGKTKQLMTFKTALTDSELETLTSWDSFTAMAKGQLYTIE